MLGSNKKKNPDVPKPDNGGESQSMIPRELPPLRTFVVRAGDLTFNDKTKAWERPVTRVVDAHGLGIDESRMISFVVFFWLDAEKKTTPAQATKLCLNADAWDDVEEINPLFPTLEKH